MEGELQLAAEVDVHSEERSGPENLVGSLVNERYQIDDVIGNGGMGVVYRAHHVHISQVVALKMLLPQGSSDAQAFKRFQQEAKAASRLNHPGIVKIQDFGVLASDRAYLAMDYVEGKSLSSVLRAEGPMASGRFINIFIQSCEALEHAHANGVVHRDIKPSNIMLVNQDGVQDHVVIVDFGLVKLMGANEEQPQSQKLTTTNTLVGSPPYMSPEQCRGLDIDHRTDIYSLGCCMYETLTGQTPLSGENPLDTIYKHVAEKPIPMREANRNLLISPQLEKVVMRALEKNPDHRQQSMAELGEALKELRGGQCHLVSTVSVTMPTPQSALPAVPSPSLVQTPADSVKHTKTKVAKKQTSAQSWIAPVVGVSLVSATIIGSLLFIIVSQHLLSQRTAIKELTGEGVDVSQLPSSREESVDVPATPSEVSTLVEAAGAGPIAQPRAPVQPVPAASPSGSTSVSSIAPSSPSLPTAQAVKSAIGSRASNAATLVKAKGLEKQGDAFYSQRKWSEAFKLYQQSLSLAEPVVGRHNPVVLPVVARLTICAARSNDIQSTVSYMNQFADLYAVDPKPMAGQTQLLNDLGQLCIESKNDALAHKLLQAAVETTHAKKAPRTEFPLAMAHLELARSLTKQGQWYDAESHYQKAMEASSSFPKLNAGVRAAYADFLRRIGRSADASQVQPMPPSMPSHMPLRRRFFER